MKNLFQTPLCNHQDLDCVSSIKTDISECSQQCSGILVTSFDQHEIEDRLDARFKELSAYMSRRNPRSFGKMVETFQSSIHEIIIVTY